MPTQSAIAARYVGREKQKTAADVNDALYMSMFECAFSGNSWPRNTFCTNYVQDRRLTDAARVQVKIGFLTLNIRLNASRQHIGCDALDVAACVAVEHDHACKQLHDHHQAWICVIGANPAAPLAANGQD